MLYHNDFIYIYSCSCFKLVCLVLKASHHGGTPPCLVRLFPTAWEQNSQVLGTVFPTLGTGSPDHCVSAYGLLFRAAYILQCLPKIPKCNDKKD